MISIHVSAVCLARDGCTGKVLPPAGLLCLVDGLPYRPAAKPEGYLVLTDLPPGPHRLTLRGNGFQDEWLDFEAGSSPERVISVTMKPGPAYPFRRPPARLSLTLLQKKKPVPQHCLWLAAPSEPEVKLAQTKAAKGAAEIRLFWKGRQLPAVPGCYLLRDGKNSEVVELLSLEEDRGLLAAPLQKDHKRGIVLLAAQRGHTDSGGMLQTAYLQPCTVEVYEETAGLLDSLELTDGSNAFSATLP